MRNIPVPAGPRAPRTLGWWFHTAPFAAIIGAYRLIRPEWRADWNKNNGYAPTSHIALAAVLKPIEEGGGWKAFAHHATPRFSGRRQPRGFVLAWALFLSMLALPGLGGLASWTEAGPDGSVRVGVSWAS